MKDKSRIAMIIPFYGKWPDWMEYSLQSFASNPQIDFILITDLESRHDLPENVIIQRCSLNDFSTRVKTVLDLETDIRHPYKLTDFKPAMGVLFSNMLRKYSHWGYADLDLVMGDVSRFISEAILRKNDVISPLAGFFPGHFMIFKNYAIANDLFFEASNWKNVFRDHRCYCFDETLYKAGIAPVTDAIEDVIRKRVRSHLRLRRMHQHILPAMLIKFYYGLKNSEWKKPDFNSVLRSAVRRGKVLAYKRDMCLDDVMLLEQGKDRTEIYWENGRLFHNNKEVLYYHFQLAKLGRDWSIDRLNARSFRINVRLQSFCSQTL